MGRNKREALLHTIWLLVYLKSKEHKMYCNTLTQKSHLQLSQKIQFCIVYYSATILHSVKASMAPPKVLETDGLKGLTSHVSSAEQQHVGTC